MKLTHLTFLIGFALLPCASASITEEGFGIVFGKDHAFGIKAPKGWMLDNESAVKQKLHAVFYPKGESWKDAKIVAYATSRPKTDKIATADDAAKAVVEDFHGKGHPKYETKRIKAIKLDSGKEAVIFHFTGDKWGNSEAVAYFVEEKTINFLVLNSRDAKLFADSLDAFENLAKSYMFMGDDPLEAQKKEAPAKDSKEDATKKPKPAAEKESKSAPEKKEPAKPEK